MKTIGSVMFSALCALGLFAIVKGDFLEHLINDSDVTIGATNENIPVQQMSALNDLFNSTGGPDWNWGPVGTQWNFSGNHNPCLEQWQGITCFTVHSQKQIKYISLIYFNMVGTLPESMGNLTYLEKLECNANHLSGSIPRGVFTLHYLFILSLEFNQLSGLFPLDELSLMPNLEGLLLAKNYFTGSLNSNIGRFPLLRQFSIPYNLLEGTIPSEIGNLMNLNELSMGYNSFNGTIPVSISNLKHNLTALALPGNNLTSTIPPELGQLTKVVNFNLGRNSLTGTLPSTLCEIRGVIAFYVDYNNLHGSIPNCVGNWTALIQTSLNYNQFSGSLPDGFYLMSNLTSLSIAYNKFSGSISSKISQMTSLLYVFMSYNRFTGTLPIEINQLMHMDNFYVASNLLTGPLNLHINVENTSFSNLKIIDCANNFFTNTIPTVIYSLHSLVTFYLYGNQMTGSIGSGFANMTNLVDLTLSYNAFTSSLPHYTATTQYKLHFLALDNNLITGEIPIDFINSPEFTFFDVSFNFLSGTLPLQLFTVCTQIKSFSVNVNLFSGSLPFQFSTLTEMKLLSLNNNKFSGILPSMSNMSELTLLFAQSNHFQGSLHGLINGTSQQSLKYIDLGNNEFTSSLPTEMFQHTSLTGFTAVSNCITGPIPSNICTGVKMATLDLNGLNTAPACQKRFVPHSSLFTSYLLTGGVTDGIPMCLFNMTNIETLHLSGNSIEWSFPSDLEISETLNDLSISHNVLAGSIPYNIQKRVWSSLDLSFNRLNGKLHSQFTSPPNSSLTLQINRLTGAVPDSLTSAQTINILDGNLFSCNLQRNSLPRQDKDYSNYQCGSNSFNQSAVAWAVFAFIALIFGWVVLVGVKLKDNTFCLSERIIAWCKQLAAKCRLYLSVYNVCGNNKFTNLQLLGVYLSTLRRNIITMTVLIVVCFMPTFAVLSTFYSTHSERYAWKWSAAYLEGRTPAVVITVLCVVFIAFVVRLMLKKGPEPSVVTSACVIPKSSFVRVACLSAVLFVNCVVMVGVNIAYVYVTLTYGTSVIIFTQFLLATFKLFWNSIAVQFMMTRARAFYLSKTDLADSVKHSGNHHSTEAADSPVLTFIILFNSILAPCLANAAVSPSCFKNVIVAVPEVDSTVVYQKCSSFKIEYPDFDCNAFSDATISTSYSPPFIYNYQCTSSFIVNYASVYVYMYLFVAFLKPLMVVISHHFYVYCSAHPIGMISKLVSKHMITLLKPNGVEVTHELFAREPFLLRIIGKLSIFLTFGVMFPPLAVVICVALCVDTCLMQLMIGYFLTSVTDEKHLELQTVQLEKDCEGVNDTQQAYGLILVILFAALFYAFFVFDIYGDAEGWQGATVIAAILIVLVIIILNVQPLIAQSCCESKVTNDNQSLTQISLTKNLLHDNKVSVPKHPKQQESEIRMSTMSAAF